MTAVGLVLVHGIGNQPPGVLAREMAARLRDTDPNPKSLARSSRDIRTSGDSETLASAEEITVGGVPVCVCEANWAALSYPDNPPEIRLAPYLLRDFLDTVSSGWYSSNVARVLRGVTPRGSGRKWLFVWGIGAIFVTVLLVLYRFRGPSRGSEEQFLTMLLGAPFYLWLFIFLWYSMRRTLRYRRLRLRHVSRTRVVVHLVAWLLPAYVLAFAQFSLLFLSAQALLYFLIVLVVALGLDYASALPVVSLRKLGQFLTGMKLVAVTRWVNRLAWVMVVLPAHSFLQATKTSGNLLSILFTDRRASVRSAALAGLPGVYFGFLVLLIISEVLIIPLLVPILPYIKRIREFEPGPLVSYVVLIPLYMGMLKVCLDAIDLLLDISNYHLASRSNRLTYFRVIEQTVESLRRSGCGEVHVLAHSLGSVITYDWLRFTGLVPCPITMLHTIGSPLDKFWYIDHSHSERITDEKGLAERLSRGWVNYWAHSDPVSGSLGHYGLGARGVHNIRLRKLGWFLVSHTHYWKNSVVIGRLREGIIAAAVPR